VDASNTRALWADGVPDLYGDFDTARKYLTIQQVSERTSLSPNTLQDALSRAPVTRRENPMFALSRPAARISNQPLYSVEQVEQALKIQRESGHRHLGGGNKPLEVISPEEAAKIGVMSIVEMHEWSGVHEQTVRRWAREQDSFPRPVALRSRSGAGGAKVHPGVPVVMYERDEFEKWLRNYIETGRGARVERIAEHMRETHGWTVEVGARAVA
jgi:predicted DNA-binding transcriptional regulator AlpA